MKITFDAKKDVLNIVKHRVSLALAENFNWDMAVVWRDDRFRYDEWRFSGLFDHRGEIYFAAFVERKDAVRIICLRRASKREVRKYFNEFRSL